MKNRFIKYTFAIPIGLALLIAGCNSEGIDRNADAFAAAAEDRSPNYNGDSDLGNSVSVEGPNRFVQLKKILFEAKPPSVISILFQASDEYGNAIAGLDTSDFSVLEDNLAVSATETSLAIVPHQELPFSLRTVIMIDTSSSILPQDLAAMKSAVTSLLTNDNGTSALIPQQEVALYTFNDNVTRIKDFSSNSSSLVDAVNNIQPASAITPTDFYGAVIKGASLWTNNFDLTSIRQGTLIIITDGTDTAAKHTYQAAIAAVEGKSVYTLGIGNEVSDEVMSTIGTSDTFALHNFGQLKTTLQAINKQVQDTARSFYYLHYASPKRQAAGDPSNSEHKIKLTVKNNANKRSSASISDKFNSSEFSNMIAEVVISGPQNMEVGQSATYEATTRWGPSPANDYLWSFTDENTNCTMSPAGSAAATITGVAAGSCTLTVQDQAAGGARSWLSINIKAVDD